MMRPKGEDAEAGGARVRSHQEGLGSDLRAGGPEGF